MKHQTPNTKLKLLAKFSVLLLTLTFINCEKDNLIQEPIEQQISTLNIKAYTFTTDSIFKVNKNLKNLITNKFNPKNNGVASRLTSETYGFSIDTSYVQLLVSDTYESFTFVVERDEPVYGVLENYVLTMYNDGNYSQMLMGYPIVETENGMDYDIANASIEVIDDESLLYSRCDYPYEEIIGWDENAGECVEWPCASQDHWGSAEVDDCTLSGSDLPFDQCSGGWVVTGCNTSGGGSTGDGTDPTDGTTGGGTSGTGEETEEDVAVVVFETKKPCSGDPIPLPKIAEQKGNSGTKGALYGCTRYGSGCISPTGRTKPHDGIDLKNEYGAPIYAMYDGFIYNTLWDEDAGYFTQIQSTVNGETHISIYFHLQEENRVRENNDGTLRRVSAGDIIGYQGYSGNLKDAIDNGDVESHVHIEILVHDGSSNWDYYNNFSKTDPRDYLSTTINDDGTSEENTNCN
jgi:Peptidase family M23